MNSSLSWSSSKENINTNANTNTLNININRILIHTFWKDSYVSYGWTPETPSSEQSPCLLVIIICELQNFEREIVQFKSCVFSLSLSFSMSLSLSLLPLSPCHHYFVNPRLWQRGCYSSQGSQRHLRLKKTFKAWRGKKGE